MQKVNETGQAVANIIKAFNQEVGAFNNVEAERFVREVIQEMQKRLDILNAAKNSAVPSAEFAIIPELKGAPAPPFTPGPYEREGCTIYKLERTGRYSGKGALYDALASLAYSHDERDKGNPCWCYAETCDPIGQQVVHLPKCQFARVAFALANGVTSDESGTQNSR